MRKSESKELIRVVSWTDSCCIAVSPLQFISFLTVCWVPKKVNKRSSMKEYESNLLVYLLFSLCKEVTIAASNVAKHWVGCYERRWEYTLLVYLFISLCKEATIAASNVAKHWVLWKKMRVLCWSIFLLVYVKRQQ